MGIYLPYVMYAMFAASTIYSYEQARKLKRANERAIEAAKGYDIPVEGEATPMFVAYGRNLVGGVRAYHAVSSNYVAAALSAAGTAKFNVTTPQTLVESYNTANMTRERTNQISKTVTVVPPQTLLDASINGSKNEFLFVQQAIAFGEIQRVCAIDIDGKDYLHEDYNKFGHRIDIDYRGGRASPMISANFAARNTALFTHTAYASMVFRLNRDNPQYSGGIPSAQFFIEGQLVRGISRSGSPGAYTYAFTTPRYSNNPAECLADYLTNTIYGRGLPDSGLDLATFYNAVTVCNKIVQTQVVASGRIWEKYRTLPFPFKIRRDLPLYECNILLDSSKPVRDNVEEILSTMGDADLVWSGGVYKLLLQYPSSEGQIVVSGPTITDNQILRDSISIVFPSATDRKNHCTITYRNEAEDFKNDTVSWPPKYSTLHTQYLAEDAGVPLEMSVTLNGTVDRYHAAAKAEELVRTSRSLVSYQFKLFTDGIAYEPGDIIFVNSQIANITNEYLKIKEIKFNADNTCSIKAVKFDYTVLAWNAKDDEDVIPRNNYDFSVSPVSNVVYTPGGDVLGFASGVLSWQPAVDKTAVSQYIVYAGSGLNPGPGNSIVWMELGRATANEFQVSGLSSGYYVFSVVTTTPNGRKSDSAYSPIVVITKPEFTNTPDTTAPPAPQGFTVSPVLAGNHLSWTPPSYTVGHGHNSTVVFAADSTAGSRVIADAVEIARVVGSSYDHTPPNAIGKVFSYWIKFLSNDGVLGLANPNLNGVFSAPGAVQQGDIAGGAIGFQQMAPNLEPLYNYTGASLPTTRISNVIFWTNDRKLYRWHTTLLAYINSVEFADVTGDVSGARIVNGTIVQSKFDSGIEAVAKWTGASLPTTRIASIIHWSVDSKMYRWSTSTGAYTKELNGADLDNTSITLSKLAPLSVDASKLVDNSVTAIKTNIAAINSSTGALAANSVNTLQIANNAVNAAKTAIAAIDSSSGNLVANSVSTLQIANNAVNAAKTAIAAIDSSSGNLTANSVLANNIKAGEVIAGKLSTDSVVSANIVSGAITTGKLFVTGRGSAINPDPGCIDASAWTGTGLSIVPDASAPSGSSVESSASGSFITSRCSVDPARNYILWMSAKQQSGTSTAGLAVAFYDATDTIIAASPVYGWPSTGSFFYYFGVVGTSLPSSWTEYSVSFGPGETPKIPPTAKFCRIGALFNAAGSGTQRISNVRLVEKTVADLIVNGSVIADKIAAGAVVAGKLSADSVVSANIVANAIQAIHLRSDSVTSDKILAGSVTTNKMIVTGRGPSINDDGETRDTSAWSVISGLLSVVTTGEIPVGGSFIRLTGSTSIESARVFPVKPSTKYRVLLWAKIANTSGTSTIHVNQFTSQGTPTGTPEINRADNGATMPVFGIPANTWSRVHGYFVTASNATAAKIRLYGHHGASGVADICTCYIEELVGADLIVDGAITADKIAANSISAGKLQIGSVNSSNLVDDSVTSVKIEDGAVTADKIFANAVTAEKILAGSIGADAIAARAITANKMAIMPKSLNPDPSFEGGSSSWTGFVRRLSKVNVAVPSGCPTEFATEFNSVGGMWKGASIPVVPGEVFKISCWVNKGTGAGGAGIGIIASRFVGAASYSSTVKSTNASGWVFLTENISIPAGVNNLQIGTWADRTAYTGEAWYSDLNIEKMHDASLIVDGAITADKIFANAVTAGAIEAGAVTAEKILAKSITVDQLQLGAVTNVAATNRADTLLDILPTYQYKYMYSGASLNKTIVGSALDTRVTGNVIFQSGYTGNARVLVKMRILYSTSAASTAGQITLPYDVAEVEDSRFMWLQSTRYTTIPVDLASLVPGVQQIGNLYLWVFFQVAIFNVNEGVITATAITGNAGAWATSSTMEIRV